MVDDDDANADDVVVNFRIISFLHDKIIIIVLVLVLVVVVNCCRCSCSSIILYQAIDKRKGIMRMKKGKVAVCGWTLKTLRRCRR